MGQSINPLPDVQGEAKKQTSDKEEECTVYGFEVPSEALSGDRKGSVTNQLKKELTYRQKPLRKG